MEDRSSQVIALCIVSLILCWLMIGLRVYVRIFLKNGLGLDDAFALATLLSFTTYCSVSWYGATQGIGQHNSRVPPEQQSHAFLAYYLGELFYTASTCFIKISFGLTLLRIVIGRSHTYIIYGVMSMTVLFTVFYFIFILFTCRPVSYFWTRVLDPDTGKCRDPSSMVIATYSHGAILCLGDLTLAALPMRMVWSLHMSRRAKISVSVLLALGSIASVATIARIPYVHLLTNTQDFLYVNTDILLWSVIEITISLVTTSASMLRPLALKYNLFSSDHSNDASSGTAGGWGNRFASSSRSKGTRIRDGTLSGRHHKAMGIHSAPIALENQTQIGRTGSAEEIMWDSKHGAGAISNDVRTSDDGESIPNGQIHKVVEFTTTTTTASR